MKNNFDVVVVGAGPAGSLFSRIVAEKGFDVLMIDRRKEIGIPVRCGEGTGQGVFDLAGIKPHKDWSNKIKAAHLISKAGNRAIFNGVTPGYVIERRVFDKLLALKAVDTGAKLLTGTTAVGYQKGKIIAESFHKKTEFKGKLIVGADGIESYVARMAGLSKSLPPRELDSCFQYEMKGIEMQDSNALEIYLGSMAPRGYVWIFPKGEDRANVGIGIAGDDPRTAKYYLDNFIKTREDLKNASITQVSSGNISVTKPLDKVVDDQLMIIGTAARHVSPIHGGGIWDAMFGARIAAEVAVDSLEKEDLSKKKLIEYQNQWLKKQGRTQLALYKLSRVITQFTDADFDYYITNFNPEWMFKMGTAEGVVELLKVVMKRPNLKAIVSGLLS
jgi:digeranylgeranylglycerophospholipid reductase